MSVSFSQFGEFRPAGDLADRLGANFNRLEEEKYQPDHVFQREKEAGNWPGDTEGRTVLALVLLALATGRPPRFLDEILARWPSEVNERGYFGVVQPEDVISEQQLSGHGWVLRALAELHRWRPGGLARQLAAPIIENLVLPTRGRHASYPLEPELRTTSGSYSGTHLGLVDGWLLSTDVGCDFICLDGVVDAYEVFGDERLRPLIEEMVDRFLQIDLLAVKAQTHATLTACRALLRWAQLAGAERLVDEVAKRFDLYTQRAWTEHHANFNWFGRPEWTEPCAIVDSLMIAMELWRWTRKSSYLEQAQLIYFNALGHAQRANGGFGCDNCAGADGGGELFFKVYEAHWCCTMRGGEGLSRMVRYNVATDARTWRLPFLLSGDYADGAGTMKIVSEYPQALRATVRCSIVPGKPVQALEVFLPSWVDFAEATSDRTGATLRAGGGGWLRLPLESGDDTWTITGRLSGGTRPACSERAQSRRRVTRFHGPLLQAAVTGSTNLEPIFFARGSELPDAMSARRQLLFSETSE